MNKKIPFVPNETDAILYVIISVLLLMSVNQVLSCPLAFGDTNQIKEAKFARSTAVITQAENHFSRGMFEVTDLNIVAINERGLLTNDLSKCTQPRVVRTSCVERNTSLRKNLTISQRSVVKGFDQANIFTRRTHHIRENVIQLT